jgi:hypothetical protein
LTRVLNPRLYKSRRHHPIDDFTPVTRPLSVEFDFAAWGAIVQASGVTAKDQALIGLSPHRTQKEMAGACPGRGKRQEDLDAARQ